jgi:hypothetical protein
MNCQLNPMRAHARADSRLTIGAKGRKVPVARRSRCAAHACYRPVITGITAVADPSSDRDYTRR